MSRAAAALHPTLPGHAGRIRPRLGGAHVVARGEAGGAVVIGAGRRSAIGRCPEGRLELDFATVDVPFAAALITARLGDGGPAIGDPGSAALLELAARVAAREVAVLVAGPTGSGKEGLARFIHAASPRRDGPFIAVNCAAIPETMLEATLFGYERGAFTGATGSAPGLFRAAQGGTLLLDEVSELPLGLQAKLLRALQEGEVLPVGATVPVATDARIVATSHRDLAGEVGGGRFRADLFYRLAVFPLITLALAARAADIVPIAAALWLRQDIAAWPTPAALAKLVAHSWPGNVRELSNVIARAAIYADAGAVDADHIRFDAVTGVASPAPLGSSRRNHEYAAIREALAASAGRRGPAAVRLGISERTLRYKLAAMNPSTVQ